MIRRERKNTQWLEFHLLQGQKELVHGVFLRPLDVSDWENRPLLCDALGVSDFYALRQVHGCHIVRAGEGASGDGLITKEKNRGLLIQHADCQAAIFYDPVQKAIANIHCGWRGSVQNIYAKTVEVFANNFGSKREDLLVCISPSLGPENAEFIHYKEELPQEFQKFQVRPTYFDFWEISRVQLMDAGVLQEHIEIAKLCTFEQENNFFSYRRDKKSLRHGTLVALKE